MNIFNFAWQRLIVCAFALMCTVSAAFADPPGRVARLADFSGDVQLANEREDWRSISRNFAITAADNVYVSEDGRAELDLGAVQLWVAGGSNVYFERLDDQSIVARISQGAMAVRIRAWEQQDSFRVLTQSAEISLLQAGFYVVSADSNYAPASVAVRDGQADVVANGRSLLVNRGNTLALHPSGVRFDRYVAGTVNSGFEAWASARDRRYQRYANINGGGIDQWMVGASELIQYGNWDNDAQYGRIWYPSTLAAGWAPFRYGRWSWVQPWGWTWVDDAPWGFAPSHYGRWVRVGNRWAWSPGSYVGRPIYAPALVTFFGGDGWSVSGSVGPTYSWVPLGWNEPFVPWYSYTSNYWRQVNRPYVRNIAEEPWRPRNYMYAAIPSAITAVSGAAFVSGRPVAQNLVRNIAERDIRSAPPARMGEVLPRFQAQPRRSIGPSVVTPNAVTQPQRRGVDPNPVVSTPPIIRQRASDAPIHSLTPNVNIVQPRVWQDPNPVAPRQQVQPQRAAPSATQNPGLGAPAVPMPKEGRERPVPRAEPQRPQAPVEYPPPGQPVQPQPAMQPAKPVRTDPRATVSPPPAVVQRPASPVVEQRAVAPVLVQPAPPKERSAVPETRPAGEVSQREKGRAPAQPQQ